MKPNLDELLHCLNALAKAQDMKPLPKSSAIDLLNHVLFDGCYSEQGGKHGWESYENKLITDVELVNLVIAHAATKISSHNRKREPNSESYLTKSLWQSFKAALLGGNDIC